MFFFLLLFLLSLAHPISLEVRSAQTLSNCRNAYRYDIPFFDSSETARGAFAYLAFERRNWRPAQGITYARRSTFPKRKRQLANKTTKALGEFVGHRNGWRKSCKVHCIVSRDTTEAFSPPRVRDGRSKLERRRGRGRRFFLQPMGQRKWGMGRGLGQSALGSLAATTSLRPSCVVLCMSNLGRCTCKIVLFDSFAVCVCVYFLLFQNDSFQSLSFHFNYISR